MPGELIHTLQGRLPPQVIGTHRYRGQQTVVVAREGLLDLMHVLKHDPATAFDFLMDLTAVDYLKFGKARRSAPALATPSPLPYYMEPKPTAEAWQRLPATPVEGQAGGVSNAVWRFELVYHLYSSPHNHRLRVKVPLAAADPSAPSVTGLWASANWFEREVWDLFGIRFTGHPDLRRLLMYEPFQGHPLRKDYPVRKRQPLIGPVN